MARSTDQMQAALAEAVAKEAHSALRELQQAVRSSDLLRDIQQARRAWVEDAISNPVALQLADNHRECAGA